MKRLIVALLIVAVSSACGVDPPVLNDCPDSSYFPMAVGDFWVYEEKNDHTTVQKTWDVVAREVDEDGAVFTVENTFDPPEAGRFRRSWIRRSNGVISWVRKLEFKDEIAQGKENYDIYYEPERIRLDECKRQPGDQWNVASHEHKIDISACGVDWVEGAGEYNYRRACAAYTDMDEINDDWEVIDGPRVYPGANLGDWKRPLLCHRKVIGGDQPEEEKAYCFAEGIGKIWEKDPSQTEVLIHSSYLQ